MLVIDQKKIWPSTPPPLPLSKALKEKSRIKNKTNKWRSRENYRELQEIKKKCKYLTFKAEKDHI